MPSLQQKGGLLRSWDRHAQSIPTAYESKKLKGMLSNLSSTFAK
jgi:hypothetical protein